MLTYFLALQQRPLPEGRKACQKLTVKNTTRAKKRVNVERVNVERVGAMMQAETPCNNVECFRDRHSTAGLIACNTIEY